MLQRRIQFCDNGRIVVIDPRQHAANLLWSQIRMLPEQFLGCPAKLKMLSGKMLCLVAGVRNPDVAAFVYLKMRIDDCDGDGSFSNAILTQIRGRSINDTCYHVRSVSV